MSDANGWLMPMDVSTGWMDQWIVGFNGVLVSMEIWDQWNAGTHALTVSLKGLCK